MENIKQQVEKTMMEVANDTKRGIEIDTSKFSSAKSKASGDAGSISIVNTTDNGKRFVGSKDFMGKINNPEKLQFAFDDTRILIGECIPDNNNSFKIRKSGKKFIIYAAELVNEITEHFGLDFSSCTSLTFNDVEYSAIGDYPVALVKVK
jgi:hypothetical protein